MIEIRNPDGKLVAIIYDSEAYNILLDEFELETRRYNSLRPPISVYPASNYIVNDALIISLETSAKHLRELRKQLGDSRDNLYPLDLPDEKDQN